MGTRVGSFTVERELARGGMGVVYVARHVVTQARVALKLLNPTVAATEQAQARFLREVRAAARIQHPGIVQVFDAGHTEAGQLYLAMELLEGQTLGEIMDAGTHGPRALVEIIRAALPALAAAHRAGIVHRDLKPDNLFVCRGDEQPPRVKLLDFGIARDTTDKSVTATGVALGTPIYMSPEQASTPSQAKPPTDVWSMGVMLYEALSGEIPFDGETLQAILIRTSLEPHRPLSELAPRVAPALTELVERCLQKQPEDRPADAEALRQALDRILGVDAPAPSSPPARTSLASPGTGGPRPSSPHADKKDRVWEGTTGARQGIDDLATAAGRHRSQRHKRAMLVVGLVALVGLAALLSLRVGNTEAPGVRPAASSGSREPDFAAAGSTTPSSTTPSNQQAKDELGAGVQIAIERDVEAREPAEAAVRAEPLRSAQLARPATSAGKSRPAARVRNNQDRPAERGARAAPKPAPEVAPAALLGDDLGAKGREPQASPELAKPAPATTEPTPTVAAEPISPASTAPPTRQPDARPAQPKPPAVIAKPAPTKPAPNPPNPPAKKPEPGFVTF